MLELRAPGPKAGTNMFLEEPLRARDAFFFRGPNRYDPEVRRAFALGWTSARVLKERVHAAQGRADQAETRRDARLGSLGSRAAPSNQAARRPRVSRPSASHLELDARTACPQALTLGFHGHVQAVANDGTLRSTPRPLVGASGAEGPGPLKRERATSTPVNVALTEGVNCCAIAC